MYVAAHTTATTFVSDEIMSYILRLALKFIKKVPYVACNLSDRVMQFLFVCSLLFFVTLFSHLSV